MTKILSDFDLNKLFMKKYDVENNELKIYIDFPFCIKKCKFCVFDSLIYTKEQNDFYKKYLLEAFEIFSETLNTYKITSIYFGGGTASLMENSFLEQLLNKIPNILTIPDKQFEFHPSNLSYEKIDLLKKFNFSLINIGVQSLNEKVLKENNRETISKKELTKYIKYINALNMYSSVDLVGYINKDISNNNILLEDIKLLMETNVNQVIVYPNHILFNQLENKNLINKYSFYLYKTICNSINEQKKYLLKETINLSLMDLHDKLYFPINDYHIINKEYELKTKYAYDSNIQNKLSKVSVLAFGGLRSSTKFNKHKFQCYGNINNEFVYFKYLTLNNEMQNYLINKGDIPNG